MLKCNDLTTNHKEMSLFWWLWVLDMQGLIREMFCEQNWKGFMNGRSNSLILGTGCSFHSWTKTGKKQSQVPKSRAAAADVGSEVLDRPGGICSCISCRSWGVSSDENQSLSLLCARGPWWRAATTSGHTQVQIFLVLLSLYVFFTLHLLGYKTTGVLMTYFHFITWYFV